MPNCPDIKLIDSTGYYATRLATADTSTPVDRWGQAADTRDLNELMGLVRPLTVRDGVSTIVEPCAGLGSGALAARHLGVDYFGCEFTRQRALVAMAKGFALASDIHEGATLLKRSREQSTPDPSSSKNPQTLGHAIDLVVHALAHADGSPKLSRERMRAELHAIPHPRDGEVIHSRFQDRRAYLSAAPALFHLCPPFPRTVDSSSSRDGRLTPESFVKLVGDLTTWLFREFRDNDIILAEYFNYTAEIDTGAVIAEALAGLCDQATVVVTSRSALTFPSGYSGFVVARRGTPIEPPDEWFC